MTWCDKLASQPTVGLQLDPFYCGNETILTNMAGLVATWGTPEKPEFSTEVPDIFRLNIQRENGFLLSFDSSRASVQFQHRMMLKHVSGGSPTAQLISSEKVFTSLMADAAEMLVDATLRLPEINRRNVRRIGIQSITIVSIEDLPPGLIRLLEYVTRPFGGTVNGLNFTIISELGENESHSDRCIHAISKPDDEEGLITLRLDWQRTLKKPILANKGNIERHYSAARDSAIDYFEELAVGDAFDGKI